MRAAKLQKKAFKAGAGAETALRAIEQTECALAALRGRLLQEEDCGDAYGDFLFAAAGLSRFVEEEPEEALAKACGRFLAAFCKMERLAEQEGVPLLPDQREALARLWEAVAVQL